MSKGEALTITASVGMLVWVKLETGQAALVIILEHLPSLGLG